MNDQQTPIFTPPPAFEPSHFEAQPREKKSRKGLYLVLGCGGCAVLLAAGLVVGAVLLMGLGMGVFTDQVRAELSDNPVIIEHIGRIETIEIEMMASMAAEGDDEFVFEVEGPKGRGVITVVSITLDSDQEEVTSGTLQLDSGEILDLFPDAGRQGS